MRNKLAALTFTAALLYGGCVSGNFTVYDGGTATKIAATHAEDARVPEVRPDVHAEAGRDAQPLLAALDVYTPQADAVKDAPKLDLATAEIFSLDGKRQIAQLTDDEKLSYCVEYFTFSYERLGSPVEVCQAEVATEYQGELGECQQAYALCKNKQVTSVDSMTCASLFKGQPQLLGTCKASIKQMTRCLLDRAPSQRKYWTSFTCEMNMEPRYPEDPPSCKMVSGCELQLP